MRLAVASGNKSQVARDLGIHATMISKWQKQLQADVKYNTSISLDHWGWFLS